MPVFKPYDELQAMENLLNVFFQRCATIDGIDPRLWRHAFGSFETSFVLAYMALPPAPEGVQDTDDSAALGTEKGGF